MSEPPPAPQIDAFPLTDKDRNILSMTDSEYQPHTWENLKELISNNRLDLLTRFPSQLKAYLEWSTATKQKYGSVTTFVLQNRLHWEPSPPEKCLEGSLFVVAVDTPLTNSKDYKILVNDWPYGLDKGISHIILWLKHRLPSTPEKGDLTPEGRKLIQDFVESRFASKFGKQNVLWFRNWTGLQSVRTLEHCHILLRDADQGQIQQLLT